MGGAQSGRKVTLDNPNPQESDVISVSRGVVDRLKNPRYLSSPADGGGETTEAKETKPPIGSPVSSPPPLYSLRDEMRVLGLPYLTTVDVQEYVQAEVEKTDKYWEQRMQKLQEGHKRMEQKMVDEYTKAQLELEKVLPRPIPADAQVPCKDLSGHLAKCFKQNQKESLKCLPEIDAFKKCLCEARKHVTQDEDDYPDQCKLREIRQAAEKKLEEQKAIEAKKREESAKLKESKGNKTC